LWRTTGSMGLISARFTIDSPGIAKNARKAILTPTVVSSWPPRTLSTLPEFALHSDEVNMTDPMMPFGKHRGKPLSDVLRRDVSYLAWFCDTVNGHEVLKQSIRALPGFAEACAKRLQRRPIKAQPNQQADLPNMGVDPGLSREQLDRMCQEMLDEARAGRTHVKIDARGSGGPVVPVACRSRGTVREQARDDY
jgi:hypothetical protein